MDAGVMGETSPSTQALTPTALRASGTTRTITIALPRAVFGTPGPGWRFAVVLTGQDGFSADQARGFAATPQPVDAFVPGVPCG